MDTAAAANTRIPKSSLLCTPFPNSNKFPSQPRSPPHRRRSRSSPHILGRCRRYPSTHLSLVSGNGGCTAHMYITIYVIHTRRTTERARTLNGKTYVYT